MEEDRWLGDRRVSIIHGLSLDIVFVDALLFMILC